MVAIFTPLSVYFLLKTKSAFNSARSLRWGALAGLSLTLVGIANPVVFVLLGLTVLTLALANFGRAFALLISLLPGIALLAPWFFATSSTDLALFALTSSNRSELPDYLLWYVAVLGLLLVIAAALGRVLLALAVAVSSAVLIGADRLLGFSFAEISSLLALGTVLLLVEVIQKIKKRQVKLAIAAGLSLGLAASGVVFGAMATRPLQVEDLSAPALVVAQADAEPSTRTLVISFEQAVNVDLVWGDGRSADERSVLYSALGAESSIKQPLAELTAQLVAANPAAVGTLLADLGIDFVLVVGSDPQALSTKAAVSGMEYFQIAGESSFGSLFRVTSERNEPVVEISAANRNWQLASLALFGLLLIPTPAVIRGYRRKAVK